MPTEGIGSAVTAPVSVRPTRGVRAPYAPGAGVRDGVGREGEGLVGVAGDCGTGVCGCVLGARADAHNAGEGDCDGAGTCYRTLQPNRGRGSTRSDSFADDELKLRC